MLAGGRGRAPTRRRLRRPFPSPNPSPDVSCPTCQRRTCTWTHRRLTAFTTVSETCARHSGHTANTSGAPSARALHGRAERVFSMRGVATLTARCAAPRECAFRQVKMMTMMMMIERGACSQNRRLSVRRARHPSASASRPESVARDCKENQKSR